ncbi:MAG TPA: hydrogenase 2 operon protein HybA [Myxococcales bacterium]|nr:hydrogenase 2 operon protein HybA [Myxococcales bacterium]
MDRRNLLKVIFAGGAAAALPAAARNQRTAAPDSVGMLFDSTYCIGCKACVVACREAQGLAPEPKDGMHDVQTELDGQTKNVIKLWKDEKNPAVFAYVKQQCMHCIDPGCVSVCMLGALKKTAAGPVTYDKDTCIGCRYCQVACPFNVPKFQWSSPTPQIVKCDLCQSRIARGATQPACTEVCPRKAVIYGKRADLLEEAHRRLAAHPSFYVDKVYGEDDLGGTSVLYLASVPFTKLGFPEKGKRSGPSITESVQHGVYQGFLTPAILYAGLAAVVIRNRKKDKEADE